MKIIKSILLFSIIGATVLFSNRAAAQNDIQISLSLAPPYSPYFSDYLVYENKTTLILTGPNALNRKFFLRGTVTGDNGITISTHTGFKPAQPLEFTGSPTLILKGADIEEYFKWDNVNVFGTDLGKLAQGDGLPEGNYTICIRAFDFTTGEALSQDAPSGCVSISIRNIEPPIINLPRCSSNITPNAAQNIVFSWNPPPGAPPTTRYLLKMAEMNNGFTNYNDALNTLTTPAFYEKELSTTSFSYTLADAALTIGKTYAFKIVAFDPNNKINFRNNGESEICYFTYGGNANTVKEEKTGAVIKKAVKYMGIIPTTTIKGKLEWAYHKDEETTNTTINNIIPKKQEKSEEIPFAALVNKNDATYASAIAAAQQTDVVAPKPADGKLSGNAYVKAGITYAGSGVSYMILSEQQKKAGTIESMTGSKKFPYKNAIVKIYLNTRMYSEMPSQSLGVPANTSGNAKPTINTGITQVSYVTNVSNTFSAGNVSASVANAITDETKKTNEPDALGRILLGTTTTNENGEFSIDALSKDMWKVKNPILSIEFAHPNFIFATRFIENIKVENGSIDLGTHTGLAKTYKLRIKVKTPDIDEANPGRAMDNATIKILRKKNFYNQNENLTKEVNVFTGNTASQGDYEVVAEGKAGSIFSRMFLSSGNFNDVYRIAVENKDFKSTETPFFVKDEGSSFNEQFQASISNFTIKEITEIREISAPTFVRGTVVVKGNETPIKGVKVALVNKATDTIMYTTTTGDDGKFSIDDIKPNGGIKFGIQISSPSIGKVYPGKADGNNENPQEVKLSEYGAKAEFNPLYVNAALVTVKGVVKNDEGAVISNAVLKWKGGGKSFFSGEDGSFTTANVPGNHTLIITKSGYRETEVAVTIDALVTDNKPKGKDKTKAAVTQSQWINMLANTGVKNTTNTNNNVSAIGAKYVTALRYTSLSNMYTDLFGTEDNLAAPAIKDIGSVIIKRFFVKVTVKDAVSKSLIENAAVQAKDDGKIVKTNNSGYAVIGDAKGSTPGIIVNGPDNSLYIASETVFDIKANKDTAEVEVELKKGTALTGKVLENSNGVKDAQVFVDGKDFIKTITDASGNYRLVMPDGEYTVKAAKQGLQGDSKTITAASAAITQNFVLLNPGFEVSKLLGFDIELYDSKPGSNANERIISGAFVKIPGNGLFTLPASYKLKFSNAKVNIVNNKIVPATGEVTTTVSEIPFELFDYLALKLKNTEGIKVKKQNDDGSVGKIVGIAYLDVNNLISKVSGLTVPANLDVALAGSGADKKEVTAFVSNGALPLEAGNLKLIGISNNNSAVKLYGLDVNIDYNKSYVFKDGLQLGGTIKLNDFPLVGNKTFLINKFKINTGGDVVFDVACDVNESINLKAFKINLGMLNVSNFGVKVGGSMSLDIPDIDKVEATFSNLGISKDGISGGQFNLYSQKIIDAVKTVKQNLSQAQSLYNNAVNEAQNAATAEIQNTKTAAVDAAKNQLDNAKAALENKLDEALRTLDNTLSIFKVVSYAPVKGVDFSFAKLPGTDDYKIQGGGTFGLKKYFTEKITLNYFAIATDGKFAFNVEVNKKVDFFSIAQLEITNLGFNAFTKSFDVGGKLFLKIPGFGIGAGANISYFTDGKVVFKDASFKMDICPKLAFEGYMGITDNGFKGGGKVKVTEKIGIGGNFIYEKYNDGYRFGANFAISPAPKIPIAALELTIRGGGFEINTARGHESVAVQVEGGLALTGTSVAMDVNPIIVKITVGAEGPIIEGTGQLNVAMQKIGKAGFIIDIPNSYFTAYAEAGFGLDLIPSVPLNIEGGARVSASLKKGTEYAMLAVYSQMNIASIFNQRINVAFAWGMPRNQGTDEDKYVAFIPDQYLYNGKVFGFCFNAFSEFGIKRENAIGFDWAIAAAKGWYYNMAQAYFYSNFKTNTYGFKVGTNFDAGGEAKIWPLSIGFGMAVSGDISGGFGNNEWFCSAALAASFEGHIGCCDGGCNTEVCTSYMVPCGIKVCARGGLNVNINSRRGVDMKIRF
jgi:hypothetical protein